VIGIGEKTLAAELKEGPVITPATLQGLEFDETGPIPFKNAGLARMAGLGAGYGHALRERQEVARAEGEVVPVLRRECQAPFCRR
jgi:hypothetical protein